MLKRRTFWIVVALCVLLAGAGAAMFQRQKAQAVPAAALTAPQAAAVLEFLPTDVITVQPRELRQLLPLSGALRAVNQAAVKARVGGEVRDVLVREGEPVKAGQVLVRMDVTDYQARLEQARGALAAARGQLDIAVKARDNNKALLEKGFISKNAFDTATSQYDIARANVESAKGASEVAQKALTDTTIRAPISGLVSSRMVQPGEKVSPDNRMLDVVDLSRMELEAAVPAADIMNVSLGQDVQVRIEGLGAPLAGKVARINPATQAGSRSILAYIQIDNPQGMLRVGMFGEAQLTLAKKADVLSVPQSAVRNNGRNFVYAIENGTVTQKPVELGLRGDDVEGGAVEVVSGLKSGELVVKNNLGNLKVGAAARVLQAGTATAEAGAGVVRK
jgi:RND family efflux transporter MFP subunit